MSQKAITLAVMCLLANCRVNAQDAQLFRVNVSTSVAMSAQSGSQMMAHPMTADNVDFFDSEWFVQVNSNGGATASFAAAPFTNSTHTSHQRDVHLRLRRIENAGSASWEFDNRADRSRIANGKNEAVVTMSTDSAGSANMLMRVRFLTGPNPETLAAGNYLTTVVGTISAN